MEVALVRKKNGRISFACDQCSSIKKRCDEQVPCLRCLKMGKPCTRLRSRKKININNLENVNNREIKQKEIRIRCISYFQLNEKYQLLSMLRGTQIADISSSHLALFPLKLFYSPFLMDKSEFQLYKVSPGVHLKSLMRKIGITKTTWKENFKHEVKINFNDGLIQNAFFYYFKYINIFIPLFTLKQFFSKKRSLHLFYSIILVGLAHSNKTREAKQIALSIRNYLNKILVPGRFPHNLEDLQIGLILIGGLLGHEYSLAQVRFNMLKRVSIAMGLHLKFENSRYDLSYLVERKLCYSFLLYLESFNCVLPMLFREEGYLWSSKINASTFCKIDIDKDKGLNKDKSIIILITMMVLSEFYYVMTTFNLHFFKIMNYSALLNITNSNVLDYVKWGRNLIDKALNKSFKALNQLSQDEDLPIEIKEYIKIVRYGIEMNYHAFSLALNDMITFAIIADKDLVFSTKPLKILQLNPDHLIKHLEPFILASSCVPQNYQLPFRANLLLITLRTTLMYNKRFRYLKPWINRLKEQVANFGIKHSQRLIHRLIDGISKNSFHSFEFISS